IPVRRDFEDPATPSTRGLTHSHGPEDAPPAASVAGKTRRAAVAAKIAGTQPRTGYSQNFMNSRPHRAAPTSAPHRSAPTSMHRQQIAPIHRGPQAMSPATASSQHHAPNA